jgi:hypothetical protein
VKDYGGKYDSLQFHHLDNHYNGSKTDYEKRLRYRRLYRAKDPRFLEDALKGRIILLCVACHRAICRIKYWKKLGRLELALGYAPTGDRLK